jgi:hypothetical protein
MFRYILRRLLLVLPIVLVALTVTFVMVQMAPGSPSAATANACRSISRPASGGVPPKRLRFCSSNGVKTCGLPMNPGNLPLFQYVWIDTKWRPS